METLNIVGGSYLIELELSITDQIVIGALGSITFPSGVYWYCGNARKNLAARLQRHLSLCKKKHWHIDYFRPHCDLRACYYTDAADEQALAKTLLALPGMNSIPGFGASDSPLASHLIYSGNRQLTLPESYCQKHQLQCITYGKTNRFSIQ